MQQRPVLLEGVSVFVRVCTDVRTCTGLEKRHQSHLGGCEEKELALLDWMGELLGPIGVAAREMGNPVHGTGRGGQVQWCRRC